MAVPLPLSVREPPRNGREPVSESVGVGVPVVVTVKDPATPSVKVAGVGRGDGRRGVDRQREGGRMWVAPVPVPVTVTGYVPAGVVDDRGDGQGRTTAGGDRRRGEAHAVAPVGRPVAVRPTVWALPEMVAVLMVAVAGAPTTAVPEVGEAVMEKSPGRRGRDVPA